MALTFGSLFAGIGGFDLGFERAGMVCKWQVEIDPFCRAVLQKHWPDVPKFEDVRDVGRDNLQPVDLICGGFPCQDVSLAGERKGLEGERSTLWSEFARLIGELRPRWIVVENVPGLLSSDDGRFLGNILRDLAQVSYDAEWDCLPAATFGAPHIRDRLFLLGYPKRRRLPSPRIEQKRAILGTRTGTFAGPSIQPGRNGWHRNFWQVESPVGRVANGIPHRVDRLRSLGNAVVPQVAEWIGRRIVEADNDN